MILWCALRRLLPLLAVLSLVLTPVTASAVTVGMHAPLASQAAPVGYAGHHHRMQDGASDHAVPVTLETADRAMDDMPCCPQQPAAKSDCAKGCPMMALCLASAVALPPAVASVPVPVATQQGQTWPGMGSFASIRGMPLPEPPRA